MSDDSRKCSWEELVEALKEIRYAAYRGRAFGHHVGGPDDGQIIKRKDAALSLVIELCAQVGVTGEGVLRQSGGAVS